MPERYLAPDLIFDADGRPAPLARLDGDEARHLSRVMRRGPGDEVELFDGRGRAVRAVVVALARDRVSLETLGGPIPDRVPPVRLTLATAVPKGDRFDWLVEKATEIGVARIVPLRTERSVVDPRPAKLDRLRRASAEACKQCGRNTIIAIDGLRSWAEFLDDPSDAPRLIAHPSDDGPGAWPDLQGVTGATVVVGPEGGFSDAEIQSALAAGLVAVGLGPTVLRVETAGVVAASWVFARAAW